MPKTNEIHADHMTSIAVSATGEKKEKAVAETIKEMNGEDLLKNQRDIKTEEREIIQSKINDLENQINENMLKIEALDTTNQDLASKLHALSAVKRALTLSINAMNMEIEG